MIEIIYAFYNDKQFDNVTCKVFRNGEVVGGGIMTFKSGLYSYPYEVDRAGNYYATCKAVKGNEVQYSTYTFNVFEDAIPNIIEIDSIQAKLVQLQEKLGKESKTIDTLLTELLAYETGVTPLPYLKPVTALNTNFCFCDNKDSILVDESGHGIDNAEICFTNQLDNKTYVTYSHKGYWGLYLKQGNYDVTITFNDTVLEDTLTVL